MTSPTSTSDKTASKLEQEENFLKLIKDVLKNTTADIIFNGEGVNAFPKIRKKTGCPFSAGIYSTFQ